MDNLLNALNAALERLWGALDGAVENLERLRRYLLEKLERLLQFLERIRILLAKFFMVLVRFGLIAAPPVIGLITAAAIGSLSLFAMVIFLSILIAYAFLAKQIHGGRDDEFAKFRTSVAPATRLFAIVLAALAIILSYLINIGVFIGVLMFVAEFFVVFILRRETIESLQA